MNAEPHDEAAERARRLAQLLETMATVLSDFNEHLQAAEADPHRRGQLLEKFAQFIERADPTLREAATLLHGARIVSADEDADMHRDTRGPAEA
jgi:hypothetical protein